MSCQTLTLGSLFCSGAMYLGTGTAISGSGGAISITVGTGDGQLTSVGGAITLSAGSISGAATSSIGGGVSITSGSATDTTSPSTGYVYGVMKLHLFSFSNNFYFWNNHSPTTSGAISILTANGAYSQQSSGTLSIATGTANSGSTGVLTIVTGASNWGISGDVNVATGNVASGTSGSITISSGGVSVSGQAGSINGNSCSLLFCVVYLLMLSLFRQFSAVLVGSGTSSNGGKLVLSAGNTAEFVNTGSATGGSVSITTGFSTYLSSGPMLLQTANAGTGGVSGLLVLSTGTASIGTSGGLYVGTGTSNSGASGQLSISTGASTCGDSGTITVSVGASTGGSTNVGGSVNIVAGDTQGTYGGSISLSTGYRYIIFCNCCCFFFWHRFSCNFCVYSPCFQLHRYLG